MWQPLNALISWSISVCLLDCFWLFVCWPKEDGGFLGGGASKSQSPSHFGRQRFNRPTVATLINQFNLIQLTALSQYC